MLIESFFLCIKTSFLEIKFCRGLLSSGKQGGITRFYTEAPKSIRDSSLRLHEDHLGPTREDLPQALHSLPPILFISFLLLKTSNPQVKCWESNPKNLLNTLQNPAEILAVFEK